MSVLRAFTLGLLVLWCLPAAAVDFFAEVERLDATESKKGDQFGAALAVGENVIAVGAYLAQGGRGAVYLFKRENGIWNRYRPDWQLQGAPGEWFGFDVALDKDGKTLVVGAPSPGKGRGTAYVYDLIQRGEPIPLVPADAQNGDEFGSAVSLDGDWLAVGARGASGRAGRLFLFHKDTGGWTKKEAPELPLVAGAELGQSVALRNRTLAVGAPLPGREGKSPGAVYVSKLSDGGWQPFVTWSPEGLQPGAAFGYSVAVDSSTEKVVAGAPLANLDGAQSGAVYLYPDRKLVYKGNGQDQLGAAVAADAKRILAGARFEGSGGAAHLLDVQGGHLQKLVRSSQDAELGFSVAIRGDVAVVGALKERAAYVFETPQTVTLHLVKPAETKPAETKPVRILEGSATSVTVVLTTGDGGKLRTAASASLTSSGGTAEAADYTAGKVSFAVGDSSGKTVEVPVSILPDCEDEPNETLTLGLSKASGGATIEPDNRIKLTIVDTAATDGIQLILPPAAQRVTGDSGTTVDFKVRLLCEPTAEVRLTFRSDNPKEGKFSSDGPNEGKVTTETLTLKFTPLTWSTAQKITVEGQKDNDEACKDETYKITIAVTSDDTGYQGLAVGPIELTNDEDENACLHPGAAADARACVEGDGTVLYTVEVKNTGNIDLANQIGPEILGALPDEVTVVMASADRGVATVDYAENEIAWNGSIPVNVTATIQILATLEPGVEGKVTFDDGAYKNGSVNDPFIASFTVGEIVSCLPPG